MMNLAAVALVAGATFALGLAGGWVAHAEKESAARTRAAEAARKELLRQTELVAQQADQLSASRIAAAQREAKMQPEVERVATRVVYRNLCLDDDGLRILADDIEARAAGRARPAVPDAATPR